ncbi:hypothetical protein BN130_76 [Cronobacter malonaticus 507]|nr:hypothetical protein BN130_76 [Cronobacter malonaticus 507]
MRLIQINNKFFIYIRKEWPKFIHLSNKFEVSHKVPFH